MSDNRSTVKAGDRVRLTYEGTVERVETDWESLTPRVIRTEDGERHRISRITKVEVLKPTASEFLNNLEPGTMFRNPRTGSEFVMLREGRYIRTKVGYNAKPGIVQGASYHADSGDLPVKPNPFEVM